MEKKKSRQGIRESAYKDKNNKNRSRNNKNNKNNKNKRNSNSNKEYSRNSYSKRRDSSSSEGSKKFENPKFFYKRVFGNYSKLYVPDDYESNNQLKQNNNKKSLKKENDTSIEFQDATSNDENINDSNLITKKTSKNDLKLNETDNKLEKLKTVYSEIKNLEKELDIEIPLESLNEFNINILTEKHLQLINNYIELIQESYKIAIIKYDMDSKIWKIGIHKLFNLFRNYLIDLYNCQNEYSEIYDNSKINLYDYKNEYSELYGNVKKEFTYFITESLKCVYKLAYILKTYDTDSNLPLHKNIKFNRYQIAWHRTMFYINDLFRYQYLHELETSENLNKLWEKANLINKHVIYISPNNGLLYHQMGILQHSKDNHFEALYYFLRSLCVKTPYSNARETHIAFFNNIFQKFNEVCNKYSKIYNIETLSLYYTHLHGIIYTKIGTEKFDTIFKRLIKGIKVQHEKLTPYWIRMTALCNIAMFHYYYKVKNDNLLVLPLQLIIDLLETFIRIYLDQENNKFLHYIEICMSWLLLSVINEESYLDLLKPKLKIIWPLIIKVCNSVEQSLVNKGIDVTIIKDESNENSEDENKVNEEQEEEKIIKLNILKSMKFNVTRKKNIDNEDENHQLLQPFLFTKLYDLEYRGFTPLQGLFKFIQYDDSISNYKDWYFGIMNQCSFIFENNNDRIIYDFYDNMDEIDQQFNQLKNIKKKLNEQMKKNNYKIREIDYSIEEERIIILINAIKEFVKEIEYDGCYWNYRYGNRNIEKFDNNNKVNYNNIDFNDLSDHEISSSDQIDIFNSLDQDVNYNSTFDE